MGETSFGPCITQDPTIQQSKLVYQSLQTGHTHHTSNQSGLDQINHQLATIQPCIVTAFTSPSPPGHLPASIFHPPPHLSQICLSCQYPYRIKPSATHGRGNKRKKKRKTQYTQTATRKSTLPEERGQPDAFCFSF